MVDVERISCPDPELKEFDFGGHFHCAAVARWYPGVVPTPVWSHSFNWNFPVSWASRQSKAHGLRVEVICNGDSYRCASDRALEILRAEVAAAADGG